MSEQILDVDTMLHADSTHDFNESFVARVVQHGLLNETQTDISLDLLAGSESEDDMPLSKYRKIIPRDKYTIKAH